MFDLSATINDYLDYCSLQKQLSDKTLKAYRIDLKQFVLFLETNDKNICRESVSTYVSFLHTKFKPKTVKRKIATLKAFFNYLEYEELLLDNPFEKLKIQFREPVTLPRTISITNIEKLFLQ